MSRKTIFENYIIYFKDSDLKAGFNYLQVYLKYLVSNVKIRNVVNAGYNKFPTFHIRN